MSGVELKVEGLSKDYVKGAAQLQILHQLEVDIASGGRVAILGASGSGKSTFLHLVGLLDRPTAGTILLDGQDVCELGDTARAQIRNRKIGFVFQSHNLLPEQTALGNVALPVRMAGGGVDVANARAEALLRAVGLKDRMLHQPGELSGGEQQRVSLARALVMGPGLILADEPTGNLDPKTAEGILDLLLDLNEQLGSTLVVVTHSTALATRFPTVLSLVDGCFVAGEGA